MEILHWDAKTSKGGEDTQELPQGNKNHFIYYGGREFLEEALHILRKKQESRGKYGTRYVGVRKSCEFMVRDENWRAPPSISQNRNGSR